MDFLTDRDVARRTASAVDAAVEAGRSLGLTVTDARVLYELFSVVVHLAPSPVVARIPTVLPHTTDLASLARRQRWELDVTRWLDSQGVPVIAPWFAEPVQRGGFSMTFWPFVAPSGAAPDYVANAERTASLHAALRSYPGALEFLSSAEPRFVSEGLEMLAGRPDLVEASDVDRARREWAVLEPLVSSRPAFSAAFPDVELQAIHGDSPPANIYNAVDGDLFADFEMVTLGPVEWDLASLAPEHEAAYNAGAERNGLRALRSDVLGFVTAVGMMRVVAYMTLAPQLPSMVEFMRPALEHWRTLPFAGGVDASRRR